MTEDPKPPVKPDPTDPALPFKVTATGHDISEVNEGGINVRNEGVGEYPWSDKKHGLHKVLVSGPREEVEKSQREHDERLQNEFRERLDREIALDGQLYDRLAQVEQTLDQVINSTGVPAHLTKRVAGLVERDKERRAKLRTAYMEEAEEYRDNGDQPEREIFLILAEWVTQGVGSVRQHSQLLDEFNRARDEYNENREDCYD